MAGSGSSAFLQRRLSKGVSLLFSTYNLCMWFASQHHMYIHIYIHIYIYIYIYMCVCVCFKNISLMHNCLIGVTPTKKRSCCTLVSSLSAMASLRSATSGLMIILHLVSTLLSSNLGALHVFHLQSGTLPQFLHLGITSPLTFPILETP